MLEDEPLKKLIFFLVLDLGLFYIVLFFCFHTWLKLFFYLNQTKIHLKELECREQLLWDEILTSGHRTSDTNLSDAACSGQTKGEAKHVSGHKYCPPCFAVVRCGKQTVRNVKLRMLVRCTNEKGWFQAWNTNIQPHFPCSHHTVMQTSVQEPEWFPLKQAHFLVLECLWSSSPEIKVCPFSYVPTWPSGPTAYK